MAGGRRRRLHFSNFFSFSCGAPSAKEDHSQIGGPGFSRIVFANDPDCFEAVNLNYGENYVSTTKYSVATFVPKSLFEQFRRVANIYFLISGLLSFTPLAPYSAVSAILPLIVVIGASMTKEAVEDWRRFQQDNEMNNRKIKVHDGDGNFDYTEWKNLRVGDIVKVEKDSFFPADLILLSSSYDEAICYVETMNLDGETNLKLKQALEVTSDLQEDSSFRHFKATIACEDPNANLYTFVGNMELEQQQYPLSPQQLLLRDSKLCNTDFVYGVVIFTGHDTKVMQNATKAPSKRSNIERKMDKLIYLLLATLVVLSTVGSIFFGITTNSDLQDGRMRRWYLRPDNSSVFFDSRGPTLAAILHFLTAMMLYGYFIPISLYVSIEVVKVLQTVFINQDIEMYHEESDKPAHARTSNLNEELGQVDTILSDKTGTLTCNSMEFIKCSIAGTAYGRGITEVERAMARRKGSPVINELNARGQEEDHADTKPAIKGFNFYDERIMNGNWVREPHADVIQKFFRLLAICHTAIPEIDEETGQVLYEAESPDEAAFVIAARELGFEFFQRTQTSISLHELNPKTGNNNIVERTYTLLNILEFNSSRKRMSIIVRDEKEKLLLLSKGADSVMFERLAKDGRAYEEKTKEHIHAYADAGLRTLVLAYRELDEKEYERFNKEFMEAKNSISDDREEKIDEAAEMIEKDLILLGATAVEDKLQSGVPECIDKLAQAGIKIWVLTGDKMETAINISFAASLLRQGMKQIIISLETPEIRAVEKEGDKVVVAKVSKQSVVNQINEGSQLLGSSSGEAFALIIDGRSLTYALEDNVKDMFLQLAVSCASVICCRSSPKQKALVTRLVKEGTRKVTLAIGDGANDVGMLQEADIGIGISGAEGMQAVMASDIAIAQFRYLERLLLVHGHWCYRRISSMICYFFYKNIAFGVTLFLFEAHASFSGQPAYNDWFMSLYNVFFTSLPVIALGVFDQDVSARFCLKFPILYQEGVQNVLFSWARILAWMFNGVCNAVTIFFFCKTAFQHQAFRKDGEVVGLEFLGATMYTCLVWVVNCQMALSVNYFTLIQHIFIWGGITLWYFFLIVYGAITPSISSSAYMVFVEGLAPAPSYWIVTFFVVIATLIPYFAYSAIQVRFFPMYHGMIQWIRFEGKAEDPEYCQVVRQRSVRPTTVGVSARLDAKLHFRSLHLNPNPLFDGERIMDPLRMKSI